MALSLTCTDINCQSWVQKYSINDAYITQLTLSLYLTTQCQLKLAAEPTAAPADRNLAVGSHGEYFPTLTAATAWCVNAAVSKAAWWPFDFLMLEVVSESRVT